MRVILLGILPIVGFAVGVLLAKRGDKRTDLSRADRKELSQLRGLRDTITITAAEHSAMGEPGAVIILDQINNSRRSN